MNRLDKEKEKEKSKMWWWKIASAMAIANLIILVLLGDKIFLYSTGFFSLSFGLGYFLFGEWKIDRDKE